MSQFDLSLEELLVYRPERAEPSDFDRFWRDSIDEAREQRRPTILQAVDSHLRTIEPIDVTFSGFGGQLIKAWLLLPRLRAEPLPTVVQFLGYGGGRGSPFDWLDWARRDSPISSWIPAARGAPGSRGTRRTSSRAGPTRSIPAS